MTRRSTADVLKPIITFIVIGGIVTGVVYFAIWMAKEYRNLSRTIPTKENIARISAEMTAKYDKLYLQQQPKAASSLNPADMPLINYNILGCRVAGYYGAEGGGVFDEENAVRVALRAGCRAFTLNISTVESAEGAIMVARFENGDMTSLNIGSVRRVATALMQHAPTNEPIILLLYFDRVPASTQASIKLMMDVATALGPLRDRHLGMTDAGDYRRQAMQDTLFIQNRSQFDGKFIILTNANTSLFRPGVLPSTKGLPAITPTNDLDLWSHGQIFSVTSTGLGITALVGKSRTSGPIVETPAFYMGIPETQYVNVVADSKVKWTIAMDAGVDNKPIDIKVLNTMLNTLGVSCIMTDVFREDLATNIMSKGYFGPSGWRAKPVELRYVRPAPIQLTQLNPQMDANGGFLQTPQV
jgi:hypothetical protein